MNELESILNYLETTSLEPHDDYTSEFTYKEQKLLWNYIKKLKEQLEQKENEIKKLCKKIEEAINYFYNLENYGKESISTNAKLRLLDILNIDKGE